jgi:alkylhydroperoxidase/carboxymuconolactone decarboxylase family protein YurZ
MAVPDKAEAASVLNRSPDNASTGPWDSSALATFREWEPLWVDQCLKMSADPWTSGVLPRKDVELISIAVNAACTNLSADGTRRHIRGALEAGATREEILMILKVASLLAIHTCSLGAPILLEEAKAAGVKPVSHEEADLGRDAELRRPRLLAEICERVPERITRDPDQAGERTVQFQDHEDRSCD